MAAPAMDAAGMARAIATAKEAAARLMGSSGGAVQHAADAAAAPLPLPPATAQHPAFGGAAVAAVAPATAPTQPQPAAAAGGAPRVTPEEARRIAQEAALRASASAAHNKGETWQWAKT
jgi:hypothetical protein